MGLSASGVSDSTPPLSPHPGVISTFQAQQAQALNVNLSDSQGEIQPAASKDEHTPTYTPLTPSPAASPPTVPSSVVGDISSRSNHCVNAAPSTQRQCSVSNSKSTSGSKLPFSLSASMDHSKTVDSTGYAPDCDSVEVEGGKDTSAGTFSLTRPQSSSQGPDLNLSSAAVFATSMGELRRSALPGSQDEKLTGASSAANSDELYMPSPDAAPPSSANPNEPFKPLTTLDARPRGYSTAQPSSVTPQLSASEYVRAAADHVGTHLICNQNCGAATCFLFPLFPCEQFESV